MHADDVLTGCRLVQVDVDDEALQELAEAEEWELYGAYRAAGSTACCDGKRRYGKRAAHRAARVLNSVQGEDVHPYACPWGHWHVGHQPVSAAVALHERQSNT